MVLDSVETLLKNIDAETVAISADHGEAFGEWGVNRHPIAIPHPKIKRVPWVLTSATDKGKYEPMTYDQRGREKELRSISKISVIHDRIDVI